MGLQGLISSGGIDRWYKNDKLHREDGPAILHPSFLVYRNGSLNAEYKKGDQEWYQNGKLHRTDGPAIEHSDKKEWYQNGELHRIDGPAVVISKGDKFYQTGVEKWYQNGELHRIDGPAIVNSKGEEKWYQNGELHRVDGPAIIEDGEEIWYQNGLKHRVDGPAFIDVRGTKEWYQNGELHRIDGPAIVYSYNDRITGQETKHQEWYINGTKTNVDTIVELTGNENIDCSICISNIEGECTKTFCGHHFHTDCFVQLKQSKHTHCPNCRGDLN